MRFSRARAAAVREPEAPVAVPAAPHRPLEVVTENGAAGADAGPEHGVGARAPSEGDGVARSLGAVGYAMFALVQRRDLCDVPSFDDVVSGRDRGTARPAVEAGEDDVFGRSEVDPHLAAVARPTSPPGAAAASARSPERSTPAVVVGQPGTHASPYGPATHHEPVAPQLHQQPELRLAPPLPLEDDATAVPPGLLRPSAGHAVAPALDPTPSQGDVAPTPLLPEPAPRASNTLAMLQEISFLDE